MRRSVTIGGMYAARFEFGPWWWRCWLRLTTEGVGHRIITGEPCVLYRADPEVP